MTLQVESPTVYTSQGVPISVTGIAQVKIQGQNEDMLLVRKDLFFLVPNKKLFLIIDYFCRLRASNFWENQNLRSSTLHW
jgi:hypothetical protein